MKKAVGYGLLVFAVMSVAYAVIEEGRLAPRPQAARETSQVETTEPVPAPAKASLSRKKVRDVPGKPQSARRIVIARYCRGHARCSNCLKIESYSREAIETGLRKELDSGRLRFEVVNVEEPDKRHYIKDYGLYTKSLVLIAESDGKESRHKVLNDVWNHLDDKAAFEAYVRSETEGFLRQP